MRIICNLFATFFACIFFVGVSVGQTERNISDEFKFAEYLFNKQLYKEAEYVLKQQDTSTISAAQNDSLNYKIGWILYSEKKLMESVSYFLRVSPFSNYYLKSRNFAAYELTYVDSLNAAEKIYSSIQSSDTVLKELKTFELAGIALLKRDYEKYKMLSGQFTYSSYALAEQEKRFGSYYNTLSTHKKKSPFLAGVYSAVIPGLGKVYAGKSKQGIGSFLPIAGLGLLAYEAYHKDGLNSARFITFGSLFSVFYLANIWGSSVAVKVTTNEFYNKYDNKILFDLHIPLRSLFN
jgi:hypothetical protein